MLIFATPFLGGSMTYLALCGGSKLWGSMSFLSVLRCWIFNRASTLSMSFATSLTAGIKKPTLHVSACRGFSSGGESDLCTFRLRTLRPPSTRQHLPMSGVAIGKCLELRLLRWPRPYDRDQLSVCLSPSFFQPFHHIIENIYRVFGC